MLYNIPLPLVLNKEIASTPLYNLILIQSPALYKIMQVSISYRDACTLAERNVSDTLEGEQITRKDCISIAHSHVNMHLHACTHCGSAVLLRSIVVER